MQEEILPLPKKPQKLPTILSPDDVQRFLGCVLDVKHHAILTTCYAAGFAHFGSGSAEAHGYRQPEIGDPCRAGQRPEGPLCDVVAEALGDPARLLEDAAAEGMALPLRPPARRSPGMRWDKPLRKRANSPVCPSRSHRTACGTPSPSISLRPAPTCAPFNCCSVTAASRPLLIIYGSPPTRSVPHRAPSSYCRVRRPPSLSISELLMVRSGPEVADIFRRYGEAYRAQHASLSPLSAVS